jgi:alpha-tubulin suppressor-like RCC1 family protein
MADSSPAAALLDLPLEILTNVCQQLDLQDLVRVAATCKRFRHGDCGLETEELPTKSPVVTALREHAFAHPELIPSTRLIGCAESWVAYLARCARQRRCRQAPPIKGGESFSLFVDASGRLLSCGEDVKAGHGDSDSNYLVPTPVAAMTGVQVRSVAAGYNHSLALGCDGRVYSWGVNEYGQLGHGDQLARPLPALVDGLEGVRSVEAALSCSFAVTQSGAVFSWGRAVQPGARKALQPIIVEGFGEVRVRCVCADTCVAFAIGEDGELLSWGHDEERILGHGDTRTQPSPKRIEALRGVRVISVAVGSCHALALAENGPVYAWGENKEQVVLGNPHVERELLPKPVEALRGVSVGSVAAGSYRSYAVADTGELWAWGWGMKAVFAPLGHGEQMDCPLPKPIESLRGVKVDAVAAGERHTLALADDGSVYVWGDRFAADSGALGLGPSVNDAGRAGRAVHTPQRIPGLRVACGL